MLDISRPPRTIFLHPILFPAEVLVQDELSSYSSDQESDSYKHDLADVVEQIQNIVVEQQQLDVAGAPGNGSNAEGDHSSEDFRGQILPDTNPPFRESGGEILPPGNVAKSSAFKFHSNKERKAQHKRTWSLVQANGTTWATILELFQVLDADAFTFQELLRFNTEYIKPQAKRVGFNVEVHASIRTEAGGLSAGVGVACRRAFALTTINYPTPLLPPPPSRFICKHWRGVLKHGIVLASLYLYDGEGDSQLNQDLLQSVGCILRSIGQPFVCGGDFQMSPAKLQGLGWPGIVRGTLVASDTATYVSGEASSEIDYFVVSNDIAPAVTFCSVKPTRCIKKHVPVMITVSGEDRSRQVRVVRRPPRLPLVPPPGCCPPPPSWRGFEDKVRNVDSQEALNALFREVRTKIVGEVIGVLQVDDPAITRDRLLRPFKVVSQSAIRVSTGQPKADHLGNIWRFLFIKLSQWRDLRAKGSTWWARCVWISLKKYVPPFSFNLLPLDQWTTWRFNVNRLYALSPVELQDVFEFLDSQAFIREQIAATERSRSWQSWVADATAAPGMPKIHRFLRGPEFVPEYRVRDFSSSGLQENADELAEPWHGLWQPDTSIQPNPWSGRRKSI